MVQGNTMNFSRQNYQQSLMFFKNMFEASYYSGDNFKQKNHYCFEKKFGIYFEVENNN